MQASTRFKNSWIISEVANRFPKVAQLQLWFRISVSTTSPYQSMACSVTTFWVCCLPQHYDQSSSPFKTLLSLWQEVRDRKHASHVQISTTRLRKLTNPTYSKNKEVRSDIGLTIRHGSEPAHPDDIYTNCKASSLSGRMWSNFRFRERSYGR